MKVPCWPLYDTTVDRNACPHAAVGMHTPDSASPDISMPWEILPQPATKEPFTRETAFLAFLQNTVCRKARSSSKLELDDATDEMEVAEDDDVAEALDWDDVVLRNIFSELPLTSVLDFVISRIGPFLLQTQIVST